MERHPFPPKNKKIHISRSGFKLNLKQCTKEQQETWTTRFLKMKKKYVQHLCKFHTQFERHCSLHRVHVPLIDDTRMCNDPRGFVLGAHEDGQDVDFPIHCQNRPDHCSNQSHHELSKEGVLPLNSHDQLNCSNDCG